MKVAFHFDVGHNRFGNPYGESVENLIYSKILERPLLSISSKIYSGDLLLYLAASNENDFNEVATRWIESAQTVWKKFNKQIESLFQTDVFVVCFDSIDKTNAIALNERLSNTQVCVSCRRIINYVADTLFPPRETPQGEKKLGAGNYRNRLLAFAEDQAKSGTSIDVICSSLELLEEHLKKLDQLANQGIHAEVTKEGTRRCLLRTVMLLDDIVSLRPKQFEIKTELDFSILESK